MAGNIQDARKRERLFHGGMTLLACFVLSNARALSFSLVLQSEITVITLTARIGWALFSSWEFDYFGAISYYCILGWDFVCFILSLIVPKILHQSHKLFRKIKSREKNWLDWQSSFKHCICAHTRCEKKHMHTSGFSFTCLSLYMYLCMFSIHPQTQ